MNNLLGSIKKLGAQAKDEENATSHLKKTDKVRKSGQGRGDLLSAIQLGVTLKPASETNRKERPKNNDGQQRRMSLHDVMVEHMGGMREKMGTISDNESDTDTDSD